MPKSPKALEQLAEPLPIEMRLLAPTAEPLVPGPLRLRDEHQQTAKVAAHAYVAEVTLDGGRTFAAPLGGCARLPVWRPAPKIEVAPST